MKSLLSLTFVSAVAAQLSGKVGPSTTRDAKTAKKVCSILDYGGSASATTDNGAALAKAWDACKAGGQILIPSGTYGLATWVDLAGGTGVSVNLEGLLVRISSGTAAGTMIAIRDTDDLELYSGNSKGAVQGLGYEFHKDDKLGPSMLKLANVTNFAVHDLALVDSPSVHLNVQGSANGEVYNMIIRGATKAGLDGIDAAGTNLWIHDVEVSNKDECVSVKSPAKNILVESIFCNLSGGSSVDVRGEGASVQSVTFQNIFTQNSNHMVLVKANGAFGTCYDTVFRNFSGHDNLQAIKVDAFWPDGPAAAPPGDGVDIYTMTFSNFVGTCVDASKFPPISMRCGAVYPCGEVLIENFNVWTQTGDSQTYECQNAFGIGACMNQYGGNGEYKSTTTVQSMDPAKYAPTTMPGEITVPLGVTTSIDIPAIPTSFYPGLKPASTLMAK